jgi:hypothetical protein
MPKIEPEDEGFIKLSGPAVRPDGTKITRKLSIKFSRFIRQAIVAFNERVENKLEISDVIIEDLHNKWVAFQKDHSLKFEIVSGEEIIKAYSSKFYAEGCSTLHKSCMTDRPDYIQLYVKNPNQVRLGVVKFGDKIAARALIWKTTDGDEIMDRVYYAQDWLNNFCNDKAKEMGMVITDCLSSRKMVQLEKHEFQCYPYVDTFCMYDKRTGDLTNYSKSDNDQRLGHIRRLRYTNGGH